MTTLSTLSKYVLAVLSVAALSCAQPVGAQAKSDAAAQDPQLEALRKAGTKAGLTIFPVQVMNEPNRNVADVLGLVLESMGMENLDAVDSAFAPPDAAPWSEVPGHFADFVKKNPVKGDFLLYAQYLGEPKRGPTEVRFIVTDAQGNLVLTDIQTPRDRDFKKTAARDPDPMGCSVLVARRLFARTGWKEGGRRGDSNGKFARIWAEKSGTPVATERKAMELRAKKLHAGLKDARISVYQTRVNEAPSRDSAERLAKLTASKLRWSAKSVPQSLPVTIASTSNEQKRLWDLAKAFRDHVRANPPEADYAMLAEYGMSPPEHVVGYVHVIVCDKSGDWVIVDFQNNQHPDFQRIAPTDLEGCDELAAVRIENCLR